MELPEDFNEIASRAPKARGIILCFSESENIAHLFLIDEDRRPLAILTMNIPRMLRQLIKLLGPILEAEEGFLDHCYEMIEGQIAEREFEERKEIGLEEDC